MAGVSSTRVARAILALGRALLVHPANGTLRERLASDPVPGDRFYPQLLAVFFRRLFLARAGDPGTEGLDDLEDCVVDFAGQAGLNGEAFKSCMAAPEASAAIEASRANGATLEVQSTPTVFVNGRRMVGADARTLEQFLNYELAQLAGGKASGKK